jgi:hypothetical protein
MVLLAGSSGPRVFRGWRIALAIASTCARRGAQAAGAGSCGALLEITLGRFILSLLQRPPRFFFGWSAPMANDKPLFPPTVRLKGKAGEAPPLIAQRREPKELKASGGQTQLTAKRSRIRLGPGGA